MGAAVLVSLDRVMWALIVTNISPFCYPHFCGAQSAFYLQGSLVLSLFPMLLAKDEGDFGFSCF